MLYMVRVRVLTGLIAWAFNKNPGSDARAGGRHAGLSIVAMVLWI